jgi:hypothetical protein
MFRFFSKSVDDSLYELWSISFRFDVLLPKLDDRLEYSNRRLVLDMIRVKSLHIITLNLYWS